MRSSIRGAVLLLVIISFFIPSISLAHVQDNLVLSLNDAVSKALENNWDIQLSKKDIEKSQEQISEAYSNAFPRLDFTGNYTRNIKLPVLFIPPDNAFNPTSQTLVMESSALKTVLQAHWD
jgi:outer membrane protein TolC